MLISHLRKSQQGFHVAGVVFVILVLGIVGAIGFWVFGKSSDSGSKNKNHGPNYSALSACGNEPILTSPPADISQLNQIGVLGNVDPPDHTLPTDHIYLGYTYGSTDQREIYAPADIVVTGISFGGEYEDGALKNADYTIDAYPCQELALRFGHMDVLSEKLATAVGQAFDNNEGCSISSQEYKEIKSCSKAVDIKIPASGLLATTDGWDLWATMEGYSSPNVVSPEYYHNVDAVCPLDYFTSDLQAQLYAKSPRGDVEPKCGEAYQDKAGTLQGGWFGHKDPQKAKTDWSSHFSLTHNTQEPNIGQVGVSGKLTGTDFMYHFTPHHSGRINREPSETTAGTVYCYQHEGERRFPNGVIAGEGKVLLQLLDNHTMKIEHKDGSCAASESFSNPVTYYR